MIRDPGHVRRCRIPTPAVLVLLASCSNTPGGPDRADTVSTLHPLPAGFAAQRLDTDAGPLRIWIKRGAAGTTVPVYIEGDGNAWQTRNLPATDPTPARPLAREIARADRSPVVAYLARPCQFAGARELEQCDPRYWTTHRYAGVVVSSYMQALDHLRLELGLRSSTRFGLIGYSGGGAIAVLIAARRSDIAWVVTVAGNLDTAAWTSHHGVSALTGSRNPLEVAGRLGDTPLLVLQGARDTIVPPSLSRDFLRLATSPQVLARTLNAFDHSCCWAEHWPQPACRAGSAALTEWCAVASPERAR